MGLIEDAENPHLTLAEQGSDPATPAAGDWKLYAKAGGLYIIDDAAAVAGPLGTPAPAAVPNLIRVDVGASPYAYTPTAGIHHARVQLAGGGGGSGGCALTGANQGACSGHGGGGEYAEAWLSAAEIGAGPVTVTIGAGGAAGTAGNNAGGTGGTTSFGALLTALGGGGGAGSAAKANTLGQTANAGGAAGTGGAGTASDQIHLDGGAGHCGQTFLAEPSSLGGPGFPPVLGHQNRATTAVSSAGGPGVVPGGGGTSAKQGASQGAAVAGAIGGAGVAIITEFFS